MAKIDNDKYYTSKEVVVKCWGIIEDVIGLDNISEIIESSAGGGAWLEVIKSSGKPYRAYDIVPEAEGIEEADFLELDIDYKAGRLVGFNPPFGRSNNLSRKFYNKAVGVADYIAFIQPISQLNNTNSMYKFDLVHSEDLGKTWFTDRYLHCCFNIYKRPEKSMEYGKYLECLIEESDK